MKQVIPALSLMLACLFAHAEPDADALGKQEGYPVNPWLAFAGQEKYMVGSYSNMASMLPHRLMRAGATPSALKRSNAPFNVHYRHFGHARSLQNYLDDQRVTGLLVLRGDTVLFEKYQYDRKPEHLFTSNSVAKSVVSLAIGLALEEGAIRSLDDKAATYAPALAGHPYGETSIRHLLCMSSGVKFSEIYDAASDIQTFAGTGFMVGVKHAITPFRERETPAGSRFKYASIETTILSLVARGATGKHLADYLSEKIWQPMGAEGDAAWMIDPDGVEFGFAYLNARLRDYARLGAMLANDGAWNGRQIVPAAYVREATTSHMPPDPISAANSPAGLGYGYQFWTLPGNDRQFALIGIGGQVVLVHPAKRLVLVQTAVTKIPRVTGPNGIWYDLYPLWQALVAATPDFKE